MSTTTSPTFDLDTLIALAGLKGKLSDPDGAFIDWRVDFSTGQVVETTYPGQFIIMGRTNRTVDTGDMPIWDRQRLVADLKAAYATGRAAQ